MMKLPTKCFLVFGLGIALVSNAVAIDRVLSIGQSFSQPRFFKPDTTYENRSYHIDLGYFYRESVQIALSFQFGLDGDQHVGLRLGPEFYLLKDSAYLPWVGTKYIYSIVPKNNQGFMVEFGLEKDLEFLFGFENMVIRASTGFAKMWMLDEPNRSYLELIRLGMAFTF